jgi:hypothetical protein
MLFLDSNLQNQFKFFFFFIKFLWLHHAEPYYTKINLIYLKHLHVIVL